MPVGLRLRGSGTMERHPHRVHGLFLPGEFGAVWSLAHGAAWSLVLCLVFGVRLRPRTAAFGAGRDRAVAAQRTRA